jgi:hypothetical protein
MKQEVNHERGLEIQTIYAKVDTEEINLDIKNKLKKEHTEG